jgi:hypothetical protein
LWNECAASSTSRVDIEDLDPTGTAIPHPVTEQTTTDGRSPGRGHQPIELCPTGTRERNVSNEDVPGAYQADNVAGEVDSGCGRSPGVLDFTGNHQSKKGNFLRSISRLKDRIPRQKGVTLAEAALAGLAVPDAVGTCAAEGGPSLTGAVTQFGGTHAVGAARFANLSPQLQR